MAFKIGSLVDTIAHGTLNEVLGLGRSTDGMSRPNKFEVTLFPPTGFAGNKGSTGNNKAPGIMGLLKGSGNVRSVGLRCEGIELPGRTLDTSPQTNLYGPERDMVTGYTYADVTATFQCSSDMRERQYFETWQEMAFNDETWSINYYDNYVGRVHIHTLDEQNNKKFGIELVDCFPKTIGAQALSYGTNNSYQTLSVTFNFRYWKNLEDEVTKTQSLSSRIAERAVNAVTRKITSQIPSVLRRL